MNENEIMLQGCRVCGKPEQYANLFYNINKILLHNLVSLIDKSYEVSPHISYFLTIYKYLFLFRLLKTMAPNLSAETVQSKLKILSNFVSSLRKLLQKFNILQLI